MSSQTKSRYVLSAALILVVGLVWLLAFRQNDNVASPAPDDTFEDPLGEKAITSSTVNPVTAQPSLPVVKLPANGSESIDNPMQVRRNVFERLTQIHTDHARGYAPDVGEVATLSNQLTELTLQGFMTVDEAISSLGFVKKSIPELTQLIDQQIAQIEAGS